MDVHKVYLYNLQIFQLQIRHEYYETKMTNLLWIVSFFCFCLLVAPMTLFIEALSFLFLSIQFAAEIFGGCTNIPCEHTQFCVQFLEIVNFEFFDGSMWSTLRGGSTRYLLNPSIPWRGAFVRIFAGGHIGLCRWLFTVTIGDPQDRSLLAKKASLQNVILSLDRHLAKTPATWRCRFHLGNSV